MIKRLIRLFEKYKIWIFALIGLNIIYGFIVWVLAGKAFKYIFSTMILGSLLLYFIIGFIIFKISQNREKVLLDFLENPSVKDEEEVIKMFSLYDKDIIQEIGKLLREKDEAIIYQEEQVEEYEEYIESWAHEIKTPLGLMTLVMDNRKEEMSPIVYNRLEYAKTIMQEDVEKMLYYARLKSARNDYFFTELVLDDICSEVIEEYKVLLQEKNINISTNIEKVKVVSDKKGLQFVIAQVISNSIKYKNEEKENAFIHLSTKYDEASNKLRLSVRDNGIGIKDYDLPFIFEKGFTGEVGEQRKNSTGMGLYLVKQVADHLKMEIEVLSELGEGFEIVFLFPDSIKSI